MLLAGPTTVTSEGRSAPAREALMVSPDARSTTRPAMEVRPILATLVGIPAAIIVVAAARGIELPIVGADSTALIALWILGTVMCGWGLSSMGARYGLRRATLVGLPLGLVAIALVLSGLFGWPLLLQPIADALAGSGEAVSLERAAIVGVGLLMTAKWLIAWLAYLPDRAAGPVATRT